MIDRLAFGLCLALLFVWSLPGTIALRFALLLAAFGLLAYRVSKRDVAASGPEIRFPLFVLAALLCWLAIQAISISPEPSWALGEIRGQWLPAVLSLALGTLLGLRTTRPGSALARPAQIVTALAAVLATQTAIAVGQAYWHWFAYGRLLRQEVPLTGGKLELSFIIAILLTIVVTDLFCRATRRTSIFGIRSWMPFAILGLSLLGSYLSGARNGVVSILLLSILTLMLFMLDQRRSLPLRRIVVIGGIGIALLSALFAAHLRTEPRWLTVWKTAEIAWDIDNDQRWLDVQSIPWTTDDGLEVDRSAWVRIAFLHASLRAIDQNPLGVGYGRNAFRLALKDKYPDTKVGHAHSGWIDLGIGGGYPALALWAAFLGSLMWRGWRAFFDRGNAHGLLLFLLATGYAGRMALDSVNKDHMLQMFMFLAGLLLMLTAPRREDGRT